MRKTLLILILAYTSVSAQEKFSTYKLYFDGVERNILISTSEKDKDKGNFTLWIDTQSRDKLYKKGSIDLTKKNYNDFVHTLTSAKAKYEEWVKTAKENNVNDLSKEMTYKCNTECAFLMSDWNFDHDVELSYGFRVSEFKGNINYYLIVKTDKLVSSSNQFMDMDGLWLWFKSTEEIDSFLNSISMDKITEYVNKPKAEALFKD